uniref:Uncharacterized protein n=1 Tax=Lutzomyia ayacuchensis TaxID=252632 RepID=L0MYD8_LUTAY|nr:hypothetical protein [Lutzomyia ayacuchensis]
MNKIILISLALAVLGLCIQAKPRDTVQTLDYEDFIAAYIQRQNANDVRNKRGLEKAIASFTDGFKELIKFELPKFNLPKISGLPGSSGSSDGSSGSSDGSSGSSDGSSGGGSDNSKGDSEKSKEQKKD